MKYTKPLGAVIAFVAVLIIFVVLFLGKSEPLLYFNPISNLPDQKLFEFRSTNETLPPIHILDINKTYNVVFSIALKDGKKTNYQYVVESNLVNLSEDVTLYPNEIKTIQINLTPKLSDKWIFDGISSSYNENYLDLTENSWIAERREFQVLVRENSLPTISMEEYHLPISNDVTPLGKIYHINVSLDELKEKPFVKEFVSDNVGDFSKSNTKTNVILEIIGNKLHVVVNSSIVNYISETSQFKVYMLPSELSTKSLEVDENTGILKPTKQIGFYYKIR